MQELRCLQILLWFGYFQTNMNIHLSSVHLLKQANIHVLSCSAEACSIVFSWLCVLTDHASRRKHCTGKQEKCGESRTGKSFLNIYSFFQNCLHWRTKRKWKGHISTLTQRNSKLHVLPNIHYSLIKHHSQIEKNKPNEKNKTKPQPGPAVYLICLHLLLGSFPLKSWSPTQILFHQGTSKFFSDSATSTQHPVL